MSVSVSTVEFLNLGRCVRIANADAEALITVDVGPRIISYRTTNGKNLLFADTELASFSEHPLIKETFGEDKYYFRGGHRTWVSPEDMPMTYCPDDHEVAWEALPGGAVFTARKQPKADWQYIMTVTLAESGTELTVAMKVINLRDEKRTAAAWGITQVEKGGMCLAPINIDPSLTPLPDKAVSLWPYDFLPDKRFRMAKHYVTLKQDAAATGAFKFGTNVTAGWAGYLNDGTLFIKKFPFDSNATYPDYNVNFESYTDANSLEVESLGGISVIGKDEFVTLTEVWSIIENVNAPDRDDDEAFAAYISSLNI